MPPGPASPASMPTIKNTSSSGAPKRIAMRLDRMPANTSSAPSRMPMLTASREATIQSSSHCLLDNDGVRSNVKHSASGGFHRNASQHRLGDLVLAHDHGGGTVLLKVLDFGLRMRTG